MQSLFDGKRPTRRLVPALLVMLPTLGGCVVYTEGGEMNLADALGDDGPCGIFYSCDEHRDEDGGQQKRGQKQGKSQKPSGGTVATAGTGTAPTGGN